jgi:TetR/AcrR family acrAB operon transcriptional repressor
MMARKTKAEAAATREALLDAAENMFIEHGVARTSLDQIARHAGMTRGAVYWHFKNKADLFHAMLRRVRLPFEDLVEELDDPTLDQKPLEAIRLACMSGFLRLEQPRYRRVHSILLHHCETFGDIDPLSMQNEMAEDTCSALLKYFNMAAKLDQLRPCLAPDIAAQIMQAMLGGLFHDWLRNHEHYSIYREGARLVETQLALMQHAP